MQQSLPNETVCAAMPLDGTFSLKRDSAETSALAAALVQAKPATISLATDIRISVGKNGRKDPRRLLEEIQCEHNYFKLTFTV